MGSSQSHWQEEYAIVETISPHHLRLTRKDNPNALFQLYSFPFPPSQQEQLMRRVRQRERDRNIYIQRLVLCAPQQEHALCGDTQRFTLIFREAAPTLADHCRSRAARSLPFAPTEICFVIRNVALGLAYLKSIRESHGEVHLGSIVATRDIFLTDPLLAEQKVESRGHRRKSSGYPSPQKMREDYDVLASLDQQASDLFSLGATALQLYHLHRDVHLIYRTRHTPYSNASLNYHLIAQLVTSITDATLRQWVSILLSPDERPRLKIYELLNSYQIDQNSLRLLKEHPFKIKAEEFLIEQIQPYLDRHLPPPHTQPIIMQPTSYKNNLPTHNRGSISMPLSHQGEEKLHARPTLVNTLFGSQSGIGNQILPEGPLFYQRQNNYPAVSPPIEAKPFTPQISNGPAFSLPKFTQSHYRPALTEPTYTHTQYQSTQSEQEGTGINSDLRDLSESLHRLSSNLKSFIDSESQQLSRKRQNLVIYDVNSSLPPKTTAAFAAQEGGKRLHLRKANSLYADKLVPTIPEVQEEHSNLTESQFVMEEYEIGTRYEGFKRHGKRNGTGKFYYSEGSCYDGEWKDNKMHGFGVLTYPNGTIAYQGQWQNDEFHGQGTIYNDDPQPIAGMLDYNDLTNSDRLWILYEGEMKAGKRNGHGKLTFINGEYFEGEFQDDQIAGHGQFHCLNGKKVTGEWQAGVMVGAR